jgi:hypothetical protein
MRKQSTLAAVVAVAVIAAFSAAALADSAVSWRSAPENTFQVVEVALARKIEDRKPAEVGEAISADGQRVYAYVAAFNKGTTRTLKVIWKRGEKVHHQATLLVKRGPSWRTWAYIDARPALKGSWTMILLDDTGKQLATKAFTIQ